MQLEVADKKIDDAKHDLQQNNIVRMRLHVLHVQVESCRIVCTDILDICKQTGQFTAQLLFESSICTDRNCAVKAAPALTVDGAAGAKVVSVAAAFLSVAVESQKSKELKRKIQQKQKKR